MTNWMPSRWNGRKRRRPVEPFWIVHCTASRSQKGALARLKGYLGRLDGRYAAYSVAADADGYEILGGPEWRMYHCRKGGNDGAGVAGCYGYEWKTLDDMVRLRIMWHMACGVVAYERQAGFRAGRVHSRHYALDRRRGARGGFYGHCDVDPLRRSDPLWTDEDWETWFRLLDRAEHEYPF